MWNPQRTPNLIEMEDLTQKANNGKLIKRQFKRNSEDGENQKEYLENPKRGERSSSTGAQMGQEKPPFKFVQNGEFTHLDGAI